MIEPASLLRMGGNAPKLVRYAGLGGSVDAPSTWTAFGRPLGFTLALGEAEQELERLLAPLQQAGSPQARAAAEASLLAQVEGRAQALPLPDGCLVVPWKAFHARPWPDALSVLAVLAKVAAPVWLRARPACLQAGLERRALSLLVPPQHAVRLGLRPPRTRTRAPQPSPAPPVEPA